MELSLSIIAIIILSLILIQIRKPKNVNQRKNNEPHLQLKDLVQKTFPKYKIIEKHQTIMICEINHRNEPDELVFIRINPYQQKSLRQSGRMLIADYPYKPSAKEMKRDFARNLN